MLFRLLIILSVFYLTSCDYVKRKQEQPDKETVSVKPVVRVFDTYLYPDDLQGIVPRNTSPDDSAKIIERYMDSWIRRKLMIELAERNIQIDLAEIERKMQEYKFDLIAHEFRNREIEKKLNTEVSEQEIEAYYNLNQKNYELKTIIIRGQFIKASLEAPKIKKLEEWLLDDKNKSKEELKSFCQSFAANCFLDDSVWVEFDDVIANSPFKSIENKIQFLKRNKIAKEIDTDFIYLLKIKEFKLNEEVAPLDFARDQIIKVIINKRKLEIVKNMELKIYNEAKERGYFEIFK